MEERKRVDGAESQIRNKLLKSWYRAVWGTFEVALSLQLVYKIDNTRKGNCSNQKSCWSPAGDKTHKLVNHWLVDVFSICHSLKQAQLYLEENDVHLLSLSWLCYAVNDSKPLVLLQENFESSQVSSGIGWLGLSVGRKSLKRLWRWTVYAWRKDLLARRRHACLLLVVILCKL